MLTLRNLQVKDVTPSSWDEGSQMRTFKISSTSTAVQYIFENLNEKSPFPVQLKATDCSSKEKHQGRRWRSLFHRRLKAEPQASLQAIFPAQRADALEMELAFSRCCELGWLHVSLALNINIDVLQSQLVILQSIFSCSFFETRTRAFEVMSSFFSLFLRYGTAWSGDPNKHQQTKKNTRTLFLDDSWIHCYFFHWWRKVN